MFCDFREAFGLDPEYNKQLEESMQEAEKKALKEKWCCTCEYYIPVDPNLPGFVVALWICDHKSRVRKRQKSNAKLRRVQKERVRNPQ